MSGPPTVGPAPFVQWFYTNEDGTPLAGGLLNTYAAGTLTPQATYNDWTGAAANTNPVVLDASGRANVYLNTAESYHLVLTDALGNVIFDQDNVYAAGSSVGGGSSLVPLYTTTDQSASGTKVFTGVVGIGEGVTSEYAASVLPLVVGSQAAVSSGIQLVGTNRTSIFFGTSETGATSYSGALSYAVSSNTLQLGLAGNPAINISPSGVDIPTAPLTKGGVAVALATDVIPLTRGGTGQTTANAGLNALLPSQTGNADKVLVTDGTNSSWEIAPGSNVFLATPFIVYDPSNTNAGGTVTNPSAVTVPWTTFDCVGNGLPSNTKAVILDCVTYAITAGNGTPFAAAYSGIVVIRNDSTKGLGSVPSVDTYILARNQFTNGNYAGDVCYASQGTFPVRPAAQGLAPIGSFDYRIPAASPGGIRAACIRLIGYIT